MPSWPACDRRRILSSYVMRNALVPQVTGLAMSLGAHLQRRHHHRTSVRLSRHRLAAGRSAVYAGDYGLVLGVTTISILAVSIGVLVDRSALSAARSPREGELMLLRSCATCCATMSSFASARPGRVHRAACCRRCRSFSPYPPRTSMSVPPDMPPSLDLLVRHHLARTGRVLAADFRAFATRCCSACGGAHQPADLRSRSGCVAATWAA